MTRSAVLALIVLALLDTASDANAEQTGPKDKTKPKTKPPTATRDGQAGDATEAAGKSVDALASEVERLRESLERMNQTLTRLCDRTGACTEEGGTCTFDRQSPASRGKEDYRETWLEPTFPQLFRIEESGWFDGLFHIGWLQHFPVYADRNYLGRFYEEGPLWKLWQDTASFYDANGNHVGTLVESPIKWAFNIIPNLLFGRKYWRLYDRHGNLVLEGSPENYLNVMLRGDTRGDIFWSPTSSTQYLSRMTNTAHEGIRKWHITRNDNRKAAEIEEISIKNMAGKTKTGWLIEVENPDRLDPLVPGFFAAYNKMEETTTTLDFLAYLLKILITFCPIVYGVLNFSLSLEIRI